MLKVEKELKNGVTTFKLTGPVDERADLTNQIGFGSSPMVINCRGVNRINSSGVKAWVFFFETARARGVQFSFTECSPAIVEQLNLVFNFANNGTVESIYLPFLCQNCNTEAISLFTTEQLRKMGENVPDAKCPKCGGVSKFDDIAAEYFAFLDRA
jgi:anti-anti-sigma regulatory factor